MTDLTPGDPSEKSEIYKMLVLGGLTRFWNCHHHAANVVALTALRNEIAPLFSRAEVYVWRHRLVTWPDLQMRQVSGDKRSGLNQGSAMPNFSSLSITRSEQSRKKRQGDRTPPPLSAGGGLNLHLAGVWCIRIIDESCIRKYRFRSSPLLDRNRIVAFQSMGIDNNVIKLVQACGSSQLKVIPKIC